VTRFVYHRLEMGHRIFGALLRRLPWKLTVSACEVCLIVICLQIQFLAFYLLFCFVFIGLVIPTVTWLRSGVRLTRQSFIFTAFKGFWLTRDHYSEYSFILVTDFIGWRISPVLIEIPLLPRCGFLVIFPNIIFFRLNTESVVANSFIYPSIVRRYDCTMK